MLNRVIRFGICPYSSDTTPLINLASYLGKYKNRNLIVVSAIPEILELVINSVRKVFDIKDTDYIKEKLNSIFFNYSGTEPLMTYIDLAEQFTGILRGIILTGDYSTALKDHVLTFSEKLTVEIVHYKLKSSGFEPYILTPEEINLLITNDFGNATYYSVNNEKINLLNTGYFLIPGSYGVTRDGKIARAGITAADYTAAFLAKSLGTDILELWGLNHGFYRADPSIIPDAPVMKRLTYSEAGELAYFDHYSLHPRTVEPLEPDCIPIHILDKTTDKGEINTIINTETYLERQIVKSVSYTDDISLLRLNGPGIGLKPGILAKITLRLSNAGINIRSVITSQTSINFILEKYTGEKAMELVSAALGVPLNGIDNLGFASVRKVYVVEDVSLIGVVGHGMQSKYDVSAKIFSAVACSKINVILSGSGTSDLVSYLVVKSSDKIKCVRAVYNAFFSDN